MSDGSDALKKLQDRILEFRNERDWEQFHDPKNLAEALVIEAGELMEHFLWKDKQEIEKLLAHDAGYREEVSDELADVVNYALLLAHETGIDLSEALQNKIHKNAKKYPVEQAKGKKNKYTDYQ